jgi:hypothetical protein
MYWCARYSDNLHGRWKRIHVLGDDHQVEATGKMVRRLPDHPLNAAAPVTSRIYECHTGTISSLIGTGHV